MPAWPDLLVFSIAGGMCLVAAVGVVISKNAVRSALLLAVTLFGVAVLFVAQSAFFLAAVQLIVYAGAVVVLFLFVIMLLGVDKREDLRETISGQRPTAIVVGLTFLGLLIAAFATTSAEPVIVGAPKGDNVQQIAQILFTTYLYPFEVTSALLIVAAIAAIVLAKRERAVLTGGEEGE